MLAGPWLRSVNGELGLYSLHCFIRTKSWLIGPCALVSPQEVGTDEPPPVSTLQHTRKRLKAQAQNAGQGLGRGSGGGVSSAIIAGLREFQNHVYFVSGSHLQVECSLDSALKYLGNWRESMDCVNCIVFLQTEVCMVLPSRSLEHNLKHKYPVTPFPKFPLTSRPQAPNRSSLCCNKDSRCTNSMPTGWKALSREQDRRTGFSSSEFYSGWDASVPVTSAKFCKLLLSAK